MNVLFLSLGSLRSINESGIYPDLLREFIRNGHEVFILSPCDTAVSEDNEIIHEGHSHIALVFTGRIQKTRPIKKGINTILIERRLIRAIKKYYSDVCFDCVLYPTPPVTLASVVKFVKQRDKAKAYLMLKDIFPQNAVDMGMMRKTGIMGLIYKYFRSIEKKLYAVSDWIGCMSQANVDYILANNTEIPPEKVELCYNSIEVRDFGLSKAEREEMRAKYDLPQDKLLFVYGGNLGRPQGIPFLVECLKTQLTNTNAFFLVVGNGTEYGRLKAFFDETAPENMRLMSSIPKNDYDRMIAACDVGMIFLDARFTVPNFPCRLLSYMQAKLPVLACTDRNTDVGQVIVDGGFGWWCESNSEHRFSELVEQCQTAECGKMGERAYQYLLANYTVASGYQNIMRHFE